MVRIADHFSQVPASAEPSFLDRARQRWEDTQFGGGKTHSLTLLYHLANNGAKAKEWQGVGRLLQAAGLNSVPKAEFAVFVGTEFDPLSGRGGVDGTPVIAFQLGGESALKVLAEHERQGIAPGGDVIRAFLPKDRPVLILMDELMNFVSRSRKDLIPGRRKQGHQGVRTASQTKGHPGRNALSSPRRSSTLRKEERRRP